MDLPSTSSASRERTTAVYGFQEVTDENGEVSFTFMDSAEDNQTSEEDSTLDFAIIESGSATILTRSSLFQPITNNVDMMAPSSSSSDEESNIPRVSSTSAPSARVAVSNNGTSRRRSVRRVNYYSDDDSEDYSHDSDGNSDVDFQPSAALLDVNLETRSFGDRSIRLNHQNEQLQKSRRGRRSIKPKKKLKVSRKARYYDTSKLTPRVIQRVVDPNGEYKAVKSVISSDGIGQKCVISFEQSTNSAATEEFNPGVDGYNLGRIKFILTKEQEQSYTKCTIGEVYPGLTEIVLHLSNVPTRSVLIIKTEKPVADEEAAKIAKPKGLKNMDKFRRFIYIDQEYHCTTVDLNGVETDILRGLGSKNTFKLSFIEFNASTSEFNVDIVLLESAVILDHSISEIPSRSNAYKYLIRAFDYVFQLNTSHDSVASENKKKEDIDWFYGQVKKYHDVENLPIPQFSLQPPNILPRLREYQMRAVNWMLCREGVLPDYNMTDSSSTLIDSILNSMYVTVELKRYKDDTQVSGFFNPFVAYVCFKKPTLPCLPSGGILADEMGLGKTVEVLSLIILNPKPSLLDDEADELIESEYEVMPIKRGESPCEFEIICDEGKAQDPETSSTRSPQKRRKYEVNEENFVAKKRVTKRRKKPGKRRLTAKSNKKQKTIKVDNLLEGPPPQSKELTKGRSKKKNGGTYDRVKPMYDAALEEYNASKLASVSHKFHGQFFYPNIGQKAYFECICGKDIKDESQSQVVTCISCGSSQHTSCVGLGNHPTSVKVDNYICPHCTAQAPPIPTKATLIITPPTIAQQWISEIQRHVKQEGLKILFYKGMSKHGYVPPSKLAKYDLIITTYSVLSSEIHYTALPHINSTEGRKFRNPKRFLTTPSPLPSIFWWRVCLDEAQMIEGISTLTSNMARKLQAEHYWCVTGTPISKSLQDLYGLFSFLRFFPFNDAFWWGMLVTEPFYRKEISLLYKLFGTMIWRTGKIHVLDQLGIPPQSQIIHWLNFSPVEAHFYKRYYNVCSNKILQKIQKICQDSQLGLTVRLSTLERRTLHELLAPFLELRQACCHPQLVKGHSLTIKNLNETLSMEDLLSQLIQKTKIQCGEDHRAIVASLNGSAGIHWLLEEYVFASDKYREVLQLAVKHQKLFSTDTLQMLHTLENLADLLDMNCPGVPFTLRDDRLRSDAEALRAKYLENHANGVKTAHIATQKATSAVEEIRDQFKCKNTSWWVSVLQNAIRDDKGQALVDRIKDDLSVYASKKNAHGSFANKFINISSFENAMIEKITELESLRDTILDDLEELQSIDSGSLVESSIACHLRKHKETGATFDYRCRLCVNFDKFTEYGQLIYSADKADIKEGLARTGRNRQKLKLIGDRTKFTKEEEHMALMQEEEELIKTTDHAGLITFSSEIRMWNESDLEKALKQLHTFARLTKYSDDNCSEKNGGRKTDDDIIQDGATHLKFFDMIKKEFKVLRILWTKTYDQISAVDELSQATTRLILRGNMENERPSGSKKRKLLSDWNQERDRKAATLNVVSLHDLRPKLDEINHDYITAQADFNTHIGQLLYLEHLEKRSYGKKGNLNEDECPICHNVLGHEWCVLPCGHSFCSECVKTMCPYQAHSFPCPLCRQTVKVSEVSFVDTTVSQDNMKDSEADKAIPSTSKNISRSLQEIPNVRGSHSTKVYAIVEKLLQLQVTNPGEKVLIFSAWVVVLDIIQRALDQNGIRYSGLKSSENKGKFQKALKRFKERDDIQALLLPIISGSKGLNIVEATHIFLVEPILNMGSELQAIGRVHRIGQTKPTFVHRFYVKSTIEEQLFEVLKTQDVCSDEEGLLSLGDLKQLLTK